MEIPVSQVSPGEIVVVRSGEIVPVDGILIQGEALIDVHILTGEFVPVEKVVGDQFWRHHSFGNIRKRPFSEIWTDTSEPLMQRLKEKKKYVTGRCATCQWLDICGGNFRVRAEAATGDLWAPDPACYLTDEEISETI